MHWRYAIDIIGYAIAATYELLIAAYEIIIGRHIGEKITDTLLRWDWDDESARYITHQHDAYAWRAPYYITPLRQRYW